jgi:hypothetical protein
VSIAVELIEKTWGRKKRSGPWEKVLAEHFVRLFHTPLQSFGQPFIVSFCEDGDLLSQWRAYGGMSGFSLAFNPLVERDNVKFVCRNGFRTMVKRVIYDPDKQRARLRFLLNYLIKLVNGFSFATTSSQGAAAHVELSLLLILEMTDWALYREAQGFFRGKGMAGHCLSEGCHFGWSKTRGLRRSFRPPNSKALASIYDFRAPIAETAAVD